MYSDHSIFIMSYRVYLRRTLGRGVRGRSPLGLQEVWAPHFHILLLNSAGGRLLTSISRLVFFLRFPTMFLVSLLKFCDCCNFFFFSTSHDALDSSTGRSTTFLRPNRFAPHACWRRRQKYSNDWLNRYSTECSMVPRLNLCAMALHWKTLEMGKQMLLETVVT